MRERRTEWRELTSAEKRKYAMAMRRLNLGIWGYPVSTLRAVHLTTKEGNDNTPWAFARDLRKLVNSFRDDGYDLQYDGALEFSPDKHLLHWHGIFRIKGGFFLKPMISWQDKASVRRELGDRWNKYHGAFVVQITEVVSRKDLEKYILKHILKEYIGVDEDVRNKFLFSRGWMREGWKKVEDFAKLWCLGGLEGEGGLAVLLKNEDDTDKRLDSVLGISSVVVDAGKSAVKWSAQAMNKDMWNKVNEVVKAWAERQTVMFHGEAVDGRESGHLYMELGRIREAFGSAFVIRRNGEVCHSRFEYLDF